MNFEEKIKTLKEKQEKAIKEENAVKCFRLDNAILHFKNLLEKRNKNENYRKRYNQEQTLYH